jgi:hypothetical protein
MRFTVLVLSIATLGFYGHAVAGVGGYLVGRGRPDLIAIGLAGGTACAAAALWLWHRFLCSVDEEIRQRDKE